MIHRREDFAHQKIDLDGEEYEGCSFVRCVLVYRGGNPPRMEGCAFEHCEWKLEGAALNTIFFLKDLRSIGGALWVNTFIELIQSTPEVPDPPIQ